MNSITPNTHTQDTHPARHRMARGLVASALVGVVVAAMLDADPGAASTSAPEPAGSSEVSSAQQMLAAANDPSKLPADRAVETARLALSDRSKPAALQAVPLLDQEDRNLDTAQELLGITAGEANALETGVTVAKIATEWQAATMGLDLSSAPSPATPDHALPSEAATALIEGEGGSVSEEQLVDLQGLDALPPASATALADFIDAVAGFSAATDLAYAGADIGRIEALASEMEAGTLDPGSLDITAPGSLIANLGLDLTPVFVARQRLLDTVVPLRDALTGAGASQTMAAGPDYQVAPYLSIELDLAEANTYTQDFMLLLDVGGDDTYLNNAGGGTLVSRQAAALVDLLGDDEYRSGRSTGINGGGDLGSGLLVDALGHDTYVGGSSGTNGGGAAAGTGLLLDALGPNSYSGGNYGANGGGELGGVGMLVDAVGSGPISAGDFGTNGGGYLAGVGFLYGAGLGHSYSAGSSGANGGGATGGAGFVLSSLGNDAYVGGSGGVNGGGGGLNTTTVNLVGGVGFLFDAAGSDSYSAGRGGTNGGGGVGTGMLVDATGNDSFTATDDGVNGGGWFGGVGTLVNIDGNDRYTGANRAVNGGGALGSGFLLDAAGSDRYQGGNLGANGAGSAGSGTLIDGGGNDTYLGGSPANGTGDVGTGMLFDGGGTDSYTDSDPPAINGSGTDKSMIPKGNLGAGAQIDYPPPSPVPTTLPTVTTSTLPEVTTTTIPSTTTTIPSTTTTIPSTTTTSSTTTSTTIPPSTTTSSSSTSTTEPPPPTPTDRVGGGVVTGGVAYEWPYLAPAGAPCHATAFSIDAQAQGAVVDTGLTSFAGTAFVSGTGSSLCETALIGESLVNLTATGIGPNGSTLDCPVLTGTAQRVLMLAMLEFTGNCSVNGFDPSPVTFRIATTWRFSGADLLPGIASSVEGAALEGTVAVESA